MGGRAARAKFRKFASFYHVSAKPSSVLCDYFLFYVMIKQSAAGRSFRSAPPRKKYDRKEKTVKLFLLQHTEAETKQVTSAKLPHGTRTELFSAAVSLP